MEAVGEIFMISSVTVFCGASAGNEPHFAAAARALGAGLARAGVRVIYGGGHVGLMGVVADAALEAGGTVVGVIPRELERRELAHPRAQQMHVVETMHERKALMSSLAEAFLVLPGGFGTLEEYFEVLTWLQLGFHRKPCCLVNVAGFFDHLLGFLDQATRSGFIGTHHRTLVHVVRTPEAAVTWLRQQQPAT